MDFICIINTANKGYRGLFDYTLVTAEGKPVLTCQFHELVKALVMFYITLSMDNDIICNANHSMR